MSQIKTGTVNINVRSFTGYDSSDSSSENTTNTTEPEGPKNVDVTVRVTSQGVEDTVYKKEVPEDTENVSATFQGIGTVTVKVYISGVLEKTEMLNLNQDNPVLNIVGNR